MIKKLFGGVIISLLWITNLWAWPWTINYVPTTDTYAPKNINLSVWETGYTDYDWVDPYTGIKYRESFEATSTQLIALSFGLPSLKIGKWEIDSDIGMTHIEPEDKFYDEDFFDAKVRFIQDAQFHPWSPSLAVGTWFVGGRMDMDAYENYDLNGVYHHTDASHPSVYLTTSKYIYIPHFLTEVSLAYIWNNYGIDEEDIFGAGFYTALWTEKLWATFDYYGGKFGQYGMGLFWYITENIWFQSIYFIPTNRDYTPDLSHLNLPNLKIENYNSPSVWIGLYFNFHIKIFD